MTNRDMIRMHLEEYLDETGERGVANWYTLLHYCVGYYGDIDADILAVVRQLEKERILAGPSPQCYHCPFRA